MTSEEKIPGLLSYFQLPFTSYSSNVLRRERVPMASYKTIYSINSASGLLAAVTVVSSSDFLSSQLCRLLSYKKRYSYDELKNKLPKNVKTARAKTT